MTATPSNVQPPHQGLVLTDFPELQAYVEYAGVNKVQETGISIIWQLATNAGFTTDLQQITSSIRYSSGQVATASVMNRLNANTWYIRARAMDGNAVYSGWTASNIFNVDHRPFVSDMQPAHGTKMAYGSGTVQFSWSFTDGDPSDRQTAYQIRAFRTVNDAIIFDTGKIASGVQEHTQTIPFTDSTGYFFWQMRVWDVYDIESPWTDSTLLQMGVNPTALILSPVNNAVVNNPAPTIQWAFSTSNLPGATYKSVATNFATYALLQANNASYNELLSSSIDQAGQVEYRIEVRANGEPIFDSGWLAGSASTYQLPAVIHLGATYEVVVIVRDSSSYEGHSDPIRFTALWPAPTDPLDIIVNTNYVDDPVVGAVQVTWNAALTDPSFAEWRVYRRILGTSAWEKIATSTVQWGRGEILDYLFESGRTYEYGVSQAAYRYFEELSESRITAVVVTPTSNKYWLIHGTDPTFNLVLSSVISDSFTEEYEHFDDLIIGRGRRKEIGTRWGYAGSLTCHLRDLDSRGSSLELQEILAFKAGRVDAFLRVPFGHIWKVSIGDIAFDRMAGVGRREFGQVTIPYSEVA
jgi:hypothetical protein